ncbi:hypothetical protein V8E36_009562 [Tilletia maclaganii]
MVKAAFRLPLNLDWPGLTFTLSSIQVEAISSRTGSTLSMCIARNGLVMPLSAVILDLFHLHAYDQYANWSQLAPSALVRDISVHITNDGTHISLRKAADSEPTVRDAVVTRIPYTILQFLPCLGHNFESSHGGAIEQLKTLIEHDVPKEDRLSAEQLGKLKRRVEKLPKITGKGMDRGLIESAWRTTLAVLDGADKQCPDGL